MNATLERPATQHTVAFDWRQRAMAARERGFFTVDDKHDIAKFRTCAVGELYGYPAALGIGDVPPALRHAGMALVSAVSNNRFDAVDQLIRQIEAAAQA